MNHELLRIKSYSLWDLFLHKDQYPYLGRCYVSAKREDARSVGDMTTKEREELFGVIVPEWEIVIKVLFAHTRTNMDSLGNTYNHLRWHLIPRYKEPKHLFGIDFIDPNPSRNWSPYPKKDIPLETMIYIKDAIKSKL